MSASGIPKLILLVDDDDRILRVMKAHLENDGYAVMTEETAEEALETVKNTKLMAVLLDLGLKEVSGFEVLQKIKAVKPELPVIIVTGSHNEEEARRAFELGAWEYITKPIDFSYLKNILLMQAKDQ